MSEMKSKEWIINKQDIILITGANGFIGSRVFEKVLKYGFSRVRCLVRSERNVAQLKEVALNSSADVEFFKCNLLSRSDCVSAVKDVSLIYHLAIGPIGKSFPGAYINAVLPTRNLLEGVKYHNTLKRFVNISSFAVYSNRDKSQGAVLDESCPIDNRPQERGDPYAFAKVNQDRLVVEYGMNYMIPHVILRPGAVYGPGNTKITGRVGLDTFGFFMHLGGPNIIPLTYVDNCAEAIVLAGLVPGIDSEIFNIVDDDLPTSRAFLRMYKNNVRKFRSIYVPHALSYLFCCLWEKYSRYSKGQLPLVFSLGQWHAYWKWTRYSNEKLKRKLGWKMQVPTQEGLRIYFESCRENLKDA